MFPFFLISEIGKGKKNALTLYAEAKKDADLTDDSGG
tara:strand:+ start:580 stop:690 length:111 start_codon:yes stop_codon:yes gene_type:complete